MLQRYSEAGICHRACRFGEMEMMSGTIESIGRVKVAALFPLLLALTGCSDSMQLTAGTPTPETVSCAHSGGQLMQRGRRGSLMCVHPFLDAGKSCSSKKDCQ